MPVVFLYTGLYIMYNNYGFMLHCVMEEVVCDLRFRVEELREKTFKGSAGYFHSPP